MTQLIERGGYAGIALLMLLENVFPPIPTWLIMPLAGYAASAGRFSLPLVVVAGTIGSTLGALVWYWLAKLYGADRLRAVAARHGHWLTLTPAQVDRVERWFDRHGALAVLIARLVPAVRVLISIPAGVFGMDLKRFIIFTVIGNAIWNGGMATAGYLLQNRYGEVAHWLDPVATLVLATVAVIYLARVGSGVRRR